MTDMVNMAKTSMVGACRPAPAPAAQPRPVHHLALTWRTQRCRPAPQLVSRGWPSTTSSPTPMFHLLPLALERGIELTPEPA